MTTGKPLRTRFWQGVAAFAQRFIDTPEAAAGDGDGDDEAAPVAGESGPALAPQPTEARQSAEPPAPNLLSQDWYHQDYEFDLPGTTFVYCPLWHVKRKVIGTFHCMPQLPLLSGRVMVSDLLAQLDPGLITKVDMLALDHVAREIAKLMAAKKNALLSVPVYFETLAGQKTRREYLSVCRELDDSTRQRLVFELVDLPDGAPGGRIIELVGLLRPFCRGIKVRLPPEISYFDKLTGAGLYAVGIGIGADIAEVEALRRINRFQTQAAKARLHTYVYGLKAHSVVVAAVCAGYDFIAGKAIAASLDAPECAYKFEEVDIYTELLGGT